MKYYEDIVRSFGYRKSVKLNKYSPAGKAVEIDNDWCKGTYWYYESKDYVIDIHDIYIKKSIIFDTSPDISNVIRYVSLYTIVADGIFIDDDYKIATNTMFLLNTKKKNPKISFRENTPYFTVGVSFKKGMIDRYIIDEIGVDEDQISEVFIETKDSVVKALRKVAMEILACTMDSICAGLFFDAKAKEWLAITIFEYLNRKDKKIFEDWEEESIQRVVSYIKNNYNQTIQQKTLECISLMSGTKLKNTFRKRFFMSITEYVQRYRMDKAEDLLLTTNQSIGEVARIVGYKSHSRFVTIFKRYRGICPKEVKQFKNRK